MARETDLEICDRLVQYLDGEISLHQFEDWFVPTVWSVSRTTDAGTQALVGEIELRLAEFSNGHWTEAELRTNLEALATSHKRT